MRISRTFKQQRTPSGMNYIPQCTGEITCTLNNQYNSNIVYKYGNSNSVSFTANILLTKNDVYLIKKYTGKVLSQGEFATIRACFFGKDGEHLAKQPLCKHGQKIAFYADEWKIEQIQTASGKPRWVFNAVCNYYRFLNSAEAAEVDSSYESEVKIETKPEPEPEIKSEPKPEPKAISKRSKYVSEEEINAVIAKAEAALSDEVKPYEEYDEEYEDENQITFDEVIKKENNVIHSSELPF